MMIKAILPCYRHIKDTWFAEVIRTASEPVLKTVGMIMNYMGIDTSLQR